MLVKQSLVGDLGSRFTTVLDCPEAVPESDCVVEDYTDQGKIDVGDVKAVVSQRLCRSKDRPVCCEPRSTKVERIRRFGRYFVQTEISVVPAFKPEREWFEADQDFGPDSVTDLEEIARHRLEDDVQRLKESKRSANDAAQDAKGDIGELKAQFEDLLGYGLTVLRTEIDEALEAREIEVGRLSEPYLTIEQDALCWAWKIFAFELKTRKSAKKRMQFAFRIAAKRALSGRRFGEPQDTISDRTAAQSSLSEDDNVCELIVDQLFSSSRVGEPSAEDVVLSAETVDKVYRHLGTTKEIVSVLSERYDACELSEKLGDPVGVVLLLCEGLTLTEIGQELGYISDFRPREVVKQLRDELDMSKALSEIRTQLEWILAVREILEWSERSTHAAVQLA